MTATPHTGKEEGFRALLSMLDPGFDEFPADLSGRVNERFQRRGAHIRRYLAVGSPAG